MIFKFFFNLLFFCSLYALGAPVCEGIPLYYWQDPKLINFGDYISLKIVERMVGSPITVYRKSIHKNQKKLLGLGSILSFAADDDIIWGSGINGKLFQSKYYHFNRLDIRSVRGPLTKDFLKDNFGIIAPQIFGDPALLFPLLFPEFKRSENPAYPFIVIPHYSEQKYFPKSLGDFIVYPTDPWDEVINKILDSEFVISSSLHGIILAEAYGIPARLLKITNNEPMFKYKDYYFGSGRLQFDFATSVDEALEMGGEEPMKCNLKKVYESFPFEQWLKKPEFESLRR